MASRSIHEIYSLAVAVLVTLPGCETIAPTIVDRYATNPNVLEYLQSNHPTTINVNQIESIRTQVFKVPCLSEDITLPDSESYGSFVRTALVSELSASNRYSKNAPIILNGTLEQVELSFVGRVGFGAQGGIWHFVHTVDSSNGKSVTVEASHSYDTGWAPIRCNIAAEEFMPAVQKLMYVLVTDKGFTTLIR